MRVKKNTIKKMVRKQMMRNKLRCPHAARFNYDNLAIYGGCNMLGCWRLQYQQYDSPTYITVRRDLFSAEPGFIRLSKVEYDAKFTAAIRNRMPEILRDTADNLAARILEQLPDGYWKP